MLQFVDIDLHDVKVHIILSVLYKLFHMFLYSAWLKTNVSLLLLCSNISQVICLSWLLKFLPILWGSSSIFYWFWRVPSRIGSKYSFQLILGGREGGRGGSTLFELFHIFLHEHSWKWSHFFCSGYFILEYHLSYLFLPTMVEILPKANVWWSFSHFILVLEQVIPKLADFFFFLRDICGKFKIRCQQFTYNLLPI